MNNTGRNCLNGKTISKSNTSAHDTGNSSVPTLLVECLSQLRDIQLKIRSYCKSDALEKDCIEEFAGHFDNDITELAHYLGDIISSEILSNSFYKPEKL